MEDRQPLHGGDIYRNDVRLDFSVNVDPLGPPEGVKTAYVNCAERLDCYPDPEVRRLRRAIGGLRGLEERQVAAANGASALLTAAFQAMRPRKVLIPVPSFYGYLHASESVRRAGAGGREGSPEPLPEAVRIRLREKEGFAFSEHTLFEITRHPDADLLILANPNNPVGNLVPEELLVRTAVFCQANGIRMIVDESFLMITPGGEESSMARFLSSYPCLTVLSAFTKSFAIPSLRLGYMMSADAAFLEAVRSMLPEWPVSLPAEECGLAALNNMAYLSRARAVIRRERQFLAGRLEELGMRTIPGSANFILFSGPEGLYEELLKRRILIRRCSNFEGLEETGASGSGTPGNGTSGSGTGGNEAAGTGAAGNEEPGSGKRAAWYRIAVRRREENESLAGALREIAGGSRTGTAAAGSGAEESGSGTAAAGSGMDGSGSGATKK